MEIVMVESVVPKNSKQLIHDSVICLIALLIAKQVRGHHGALVREHVGKMVVNKQEHAQL
jgi:predicted DNA repair protein MutK